ncbi:helix-turn-helix domain-containing protein [Mesorhizobium sp. B292B1B]|uniref:helix-turn-helix domain-containing protein n=1 Tax=unclassified Mesorhizobium TaxID=325217 RepID=UPI00112D8335|nr:MULTISPECIES: helix-turn-helix transcriptional regulator [unclassified Mesorhizobium]MBZ9921928.1 helix-turn-helix domain-containing protein [Mesorhizobium sp. BR1-1-7]MBZ9965899.1 helix-turn-helix domain-containing protein [Mesorhizobium sp. BR1-1-2]MCA0012032.1 helix-turn-helix domain-containing protein [Mesorhizobium sp. B294B1A1]MCA0038286.1 helix-turn-helix domain-containing protein [Mesorhizobium sp. B292B1B]TPM43992.1 helix-turn-helix transcriptional regulator [Mesorhizobium sp. B2-3
MRLRFIFARNLRLLRQGSGLSQEQLADLAGLDRNYIGKLEREESSPTLDTLEVLALALHIDAEVLIRRSRP